MSNPNSQNTPTVASAQAHNAASIIAAINILLVIGFLIYLCTFLGGGMICLPAAIAMVIICIVIGAIWNRVKKAGIGIFTASIGISLLLVVGIALIGFYGKNTQVVSFDGGGTWVSDKKIGTALSNTVFFPSSFTAALFGYNCNNAYGPDCSSALWLLGNTIDGAIIAGGVVTGNVLARRRLALLGSIS